jgi:hypothetical protein
MTMATDLVRYTPKRIKFCHGPKCGDWFMPTGGTQLFCSPKCKLNAKTESSKSLQRCERCRSPFIGRSRFCSMSCAKINLWETDEEAQSKMPKILKLYADGFGLKAIAKETGIARSTLRSWLVMSGNKEERDPHEARRSSPTKRGDLGSAHPIAVLRAIEATQEAASKKRSAKRIKLKGSGLELFEFAASRREKEAAIRTSERQNQKSVDAGFQSRYHERYQTNVEFRAKEILKKRLNKFVATGSGTRAGDLIGCSWLEFRAYIEGQWEEWMTWDNMGHPKKGNWQIDHIVPCSWFDHENEEHLRMCWHHLNLRPLCALENLTRSNRPDDLIETLGKLPEHEVKHKLIAHSSQCYDNQ